MDRTWKWKMGGVLGLIFLSLFAILPSVFHIPEQRELLSAQNKPFPWYFSWIPEKGINLGLDLKGGIYAEFEIDLKDALAGRINIASQELMRNVEKRNFSPTSWDFKPDTLLLVAQFDNAGKKAGFLKEALKYANIINSQSEYLFEKRSETAEPSSITLGVPPNYQEALKKDILHQAVQSVRNRIDRYGLAEPTVQMQGTDRIVVELPGVKDPDRAIKVVQQAGVLEFKLVDSRTQPAELSEWIQEVRTKNNLPVSFSYEDVKKLNTVLKDKLPQGTEVAFQMTRDNITGKTTGGVPHLLDSKAYVTGDMLESARIDYQNTDPIVSLSFNAQGAKAFGDLTKANVQKQLAILLDGNVHSSPVIREPIMNGKAQIDLGYGNRNDLLKEAQDLTLVLQEGALPAHLTVATKTVVGPTLGADSIRISFWAMILGAGLVILFMTLYYKASGLLANFAVLINTLFIFAALAMFQATLTLPGMAGIILTIGMAVDANVLIFERMREEIAAGKLPREAVDLGYSNAFRAILDSNLTTIIASVILYQFGTGPIKGFAITLMIGLVCNLFTAVSMTRGVFDYFIVQRKVERLSI